MARPWKVLILKDYDQTYHPKLQPCAHYAVQLTPPKESEGVKESIIFTLWKEKERKKRLNTAGFW